MLDAILKFQQMFIGQFVKTEPNEIKSSQGPSAPLNTIFRIWDMIDLIP